MNTDSRNLREVRKYIEDNYREKGWKPRQLIEYEISTVTNMMPYSRITRHIHIQISPILGQLKIAFGVCMYI